MKKYKISVIARREFLTAVKKKSYIAITIGIPVFFTLVLLLSGFHSYFFANRLSTELKIIGIVDNVNILPSGDLKTYLQDHLEVPEETLLSQIRRYDEEFISHLTFVRYKSKEEGIKDLKNSSISSLYMIPEDYFQKGKVFSYARSNQVLMDTNYFIKWVLRSFLLKEIENPYLAKRLLYPATVKHFVINKEGHVTEEDDIKVIGSVLIPYIASGIMMMIIFLPASYLLQSVSEEKENKIIELLLSATSAEELLIGKMIGLGSAGLIQAFVWLIFIAVPLSLGTVVFKVSLLMVLLYFVYIMLGFLLYGSLMAGIGAIGCDSKQSGQIAGIFSGFSLLPLMFTPYIILDPNGIVAKVLSYFPFTTSVTVMIRLATGELDFYDIWLTLFILIPSIYIAIKFSTKIFRVGLLMQGKKLTLKELFTCVQKAL